MSNYRFGDDYELSYYPQESSDGMGGVNWGMVDRVEIEGDVYVKELVCQRIVKGKKYGFDKRVCSNCGYGLGDYRWYYCPKCGAKIIQGVDNAD